MNDISVILSSAIRLTAPLAFAGAGEYVAERGGSLIISIEGMMLSGAFFGILGSSVFGNPVLGLMCGVLGGLAVAMLHANLSYRLDANRSEEHTSELQSLMRISYAVFCLKKKNKKESNKQHQHHKPKT